MSLNFVGGIPFSLLYDGVKLGIRKFRKFRKELRNLQITLDGLEPYIIQDIEDNNVQLHRSTATIGSIKTQVEEGNKLVDMMLKLSMWNIRIWGNCFNCIGPDWAEKLSDLDGSLRALSNRLQMEMYKNITDILSLAISNGDKLDRLSKNVQVVLDRQMEKNEATGSTAWNNDQQVASSSGGGGGGGGATPAPALGVVFQHLLAIAMKVNVKNMMLKRVIERFKSTLHCLQPLIEEMAKHNRILHLPSEEVKNLIKQLKDGAELVRKCSKIRKRANCKKKDCITKIMSLNKSLQRLIIRLKVQVEKNVKETSDSTDKIEAVIKNIEAGGVAKTDDKGHNPVEPGSPAVAQDVPQFNMPVSKDVIKETSDSTDRNIELVDSALKLARNIVRMEVDKNSGRGESPIEIVEAAETEPPSPLRDVPRNVENAGVLEQIETEIATAEPTKVGLKQSDKAKETLLEHLESRANARVSLSKKWFRRKRKKGNVVLWILPSICNKGSNVSTFCSRVKPFQKHSETEMIMQAAFPEECIGNIISLTSPADACRLSLVSKHFKWAADSDQVWENFLPSPHLVHAIESQSASSSAVVPAKSKKELYLSLCDNSVLVDNGKMSFSLDKWSGRKCYMICARELHIVLQDKSPYWKWMSLAASRFEEVASLDDVCWLEIRGKIDMSILSPWTLYKAYLVYKLTNRHYGFDVPVEVAVCGRHHGFEYGPLDAALGGAENKHTKVYLDPDLEIIDGARCPNERADGWLEIELGEFQCQAKEDGEMEMVCAEYKNLCWKSGLVVQGIEVRPGRMEYLRPKAMQEDHISDSKACSEL